ncbi:nuclear transport factor 2 family protein [Terricaulis sp.]|uniref:nuclear transport factor 2 family protein n=1 Tax=Terricaulis sp. TaxID=2768686 RepID=UPI003784A7B6
MQTDVMEALAAGISTGAYDGLERYFTPDFVLHDPRTPDWPRGIEGARRMIASFRALGDDVRLNILDMTEDADKVAVRWACSWRRDGVTDTASIIAIYRFADGLIAEDWGIGVRAAWP